MSAWALLTSSFEQTICAHHVKFQHNSGVCDVEISSESLAAANWLNRLGLDSVNNAFGNKITALEWHPDSKILAVGTKDGSFVLCNTSEKNFDCHYIEVGVIYPVA